jgi:putative flippase GtrA
LLETIARISIGVAGASALWIAIDETREPQHMGVMNVVWPVSALYFSVLAVWAYYRIGKKKTRKAMAVMEQEHSVRTGSGNDGGPTPAQVAVATSHCGAGCMLADVGAEFAIAAAGITLFGSVLWAEYAIDLVAAWALGIVFQYFAIQPMRELAFGKAVAAAIKADTLSILAFQVGMYGWMALTYFVLFPWPHLNPFEPGYWLMMQIGMVCGFATSYPMNRLLMRTGLKEEM